jgi:hypothetical protein
MTWRSSLQYLWKAARAGIARLNRLLAETGNSDEDMIFHVRMPGTNGDQRISDGAPSTHENPERRSGSMLSLAERNMWRWVFSI